MSRSRKIAPKPDTAASEAADLVSGIVLTKAIKVAGAFRKIGEILTGLAPAVEAEILAKGYGAAAGGADAAEFDIDDEDTETA